METRPAKIIIAADYDAYAWSDGASTILKYHFPELPEVEEIEEELIQWTGKFWEAENDDPKFPWEEFHNQGLALARRFHEALPAEYDLEIWYMRPTEDPKAKQNQDPIILRRRKTPFQNS
jgi:hypothetical protein